MLACHAGGLGSIPRRCKVILFKLNWFMTSIKAKIVTHIIYSLCSAATIHRMVNWFLNTFYWVVFDFAIGSTYYNTITVINFLLPKLETFLFRSTTYVQCNLLTLSIVSTFLLSDVISDCRKSIELRWKDLMLALPGSGTFVHI